MTPEAKKAIIAVNKYYIDKYKNDILRLEGKICTMTEQNTRLEAELSPIEDKVFVQRQTVMLTVEGKPFRCMECGANCFRKLPEDRYACNGCEATYTSR